MTFSITRRLFAEALGTLILVGTVVGSGIMATNLTSDTALALWGNTAATGAILVVLILIFGPISGAHFNPAVSLAFFLRRELSLAVLALYVIAQCAGGVVGAGIAHLMFDAPFIQLSETVRSGPSQWLSEGVATFALLAAIFGCVRFNPVAVPYAVGLVITAGYWWTSSTSFANPAVTLARGFTDTFAGIRPTDVPVFIAVQLATAVLVTWIFIWLLREEADESPDHA